MMLLFLIGMAMSAILTFAVGLFGFLGLMARVVDQPLQLLEPREGSALYVEIPAAQETRAVADIPDLFSGRKEPS
jgi:hypothetical protein